MLASAVSGFGSAVIVALQRMREQLQPTKCGLDGDVSRAGVCDRAVRSQLFFWGKHLIRF